VAVRNDVEDAAHDMRSVLQDLRETWKSIVELIGGRPRVVYPHVLGKLQYEKTNNLSAHRTIDLLRLDENECAC
jgi:hypothetical protein